MRLGSQPGSERTKVIQSDAWQQTLRNCFSLWVVCVVRRLTQSVNIMREVVESVSMTRVSHNTESSTAFVATTQHLVVGFRRWMFLV